MDIRSTATQTVTFAERIRGAIWGEFVGDAYCLGSHWVYDLAELARLFPGGPRGFDIPASGHYHYGKVAGDLTHYGEAALLQLQSLAERGGFDAVDFGSRFVTLMASPDYGGYRDHAAKGTVANAQKFREAHPGEPYAFQDGADDDQPATVSRLAPLAALYWRERNFLAVVERATRVCQNNSRAVAYAQAHALILRELYAGSPLTEAFRVTAATMTATGENGVEVAEKIEQASAGRDREVTAATLDFGQACPLAQSFPAAVQTALHYDSDFAGAIKATAEAGGDSAGRAAMVGAWLGAALGIAAVPAGWRERLAAREIIAAGIERIVNLT